MKLPGQLLRGCFVRQGIARARGVPIVYAFNGLTALWRCFPRQQVIDAVDLLVRDACECFGQPGLGIDAIQFGGFDQGVGDGGGATPGL